MSIRALGTWVSKQSKTTVSANARQSKVSSDRVGTRGPSAGLEGLCGWSRRGGSWRERPGPGRKGARSHSRGSGSGPAATWRGGLPWPLCSRPLCSPRRAPGPPALALDFSGSSVLPGAPGRDVTCGSGRGRSVRPASPAGSAGLSSPFVAWPSQRPGGRRLACRGLQGRGLALPAQQRWLRPVP